MPQQVNPLMIPFISGVFALLGVLLGASITYVCALTLANRNARREAGRRLREAFAPELAALHPTSGDRSLTPAVIEERLRNAFPRHRAAIVEAGFYLSANERENFEKVWRAYYEFGGGVSFLDYSTDEENGYQLFQDRVHAILAFFI